MKFTTWPQNHNAPLRHGVLEYWSGEKATEECSAERRPTKKSIRRQMVGRDSVEPTSLHRSILRHSIPPLGNELVEHRHACLCAQRGFILLKGNRLHACLAPRLGSLCSAPSGQRAAKKWQPSDSVSKFDMLGLLYA